MTDADRSDATQVAADDDALPFFRMPRKQDDALSPCKKPTSMPITTPVESPTTPKQSSAWPE
ncbi:hypothetical protein N7517_007208 [Penicillium concentricum]|uniref:Uncharacterized protein n=1 Tax=Penicillium concentricum TaxID=293559 RepID=A0A9W9SAP7_9EURO|nr:uncharacterized protein N7517_007208 [Penicillium concentricum]KAJ5375202.1 hypothetical protein N7517_007208 [Penicillium concentricum]